MTKEQLQQLLDRTKVALPQLREEAKNAQDAVLRQEGAILALEKLVEMAGLEEPNGLPNNLP